MNFKPRLTISMPSYGRPRRTIRAIECIAKQKSHNFEAFVTGDGCDIIQGFLNSNYFDDIHAELEKKSSKLIIKNLDMNYGGHGYEITNRHIQQASGSYFIFFANDDFILENHFEHYLSEIENTDYDMVYFNSFINPTQNVRVSDLKYGSIGHSEIIVNTKILKKMPLHHKEYGHDWSLIENLVKSNAKIKKANSGMTTYYVMSLSDNREKHID